MSLDGMMKTTISVYWYPTDRLSNRTSSGLVGPAIQSGAARSAGATRASRVAMSLDDPRADACAVIVPREPLLPLAVSVNRRCTTLCHLTLFGRVAPRRGAHPQPDRVDRRGWLRQDPDRAPAPPRRAAPRLRGRSRRRGRVRAHRGPRPARPPPPDRRQAPVRVANPPPDHDPLDHVYLVKTLDDPEGLWNALASVADLLRVPPRGSRTTRPTPRRRFRLVAVSRDGRARREGAVERAGALGRVAALLREYAHKHDLAVVLTNHVVDAVTPDQGNGPRGFAGAGTTGRGRGPGSGSHDFSGPRQRRLFGAAGDVRSSGRAVAPSLGLFWANCVNTRVFLSRTGGSAGGFGGGEGVGGGGTVGGVRRTARIVFPRISSRRGMGGRQCGPPPCAFEVREDGTWGIARVEDADERA